MWLAPVQVKVLPIGERHIEYAKHIASLLRKENFRVDIDTRDEKIGQKIRVAQLEQVPYMTIIGDREVSEQTVSLRHRRKGDLDSLTIEQLVRQLSDEIR
jgi:threonyl-tRNA synthetase